MGAKLTLYDDQLSERLAVVAAGVDGVLRRGVYEGAKVAADAVDKAIDTIPASTNVTKGLTGAQRKGLHEGLGIARMRSEGGKVHTRTGFSGYNAVGQPNVMLARSWEGGSSINEPTHFASRAIRNSKDRAVEAMREAVEGGLEELAR